jgi:heme ABC exporter ATP-binding subunit CcmA
LIELHNLVKRFGSVRALDGVSLQIGSGSTVAIFGANGSGKSTLLRVVAGLLKPTTGTVQLAGGDPRAAKERIGYLGHNPHLYPYLSATENLRFYARLYGVDNSLGQELLRRIGLVHKLDAQVRTFSRRETQRLGLARSLLHDPDYLLLDEPFSGLDKSAVEDFPALIARPGRTILMSTHDEVMGRALGDQYVTLSEGRLTSTR